MVYWGDGNSDHITAYNQAERDHTYAGNGTYQIQIDGQCPSFEFDNGGDNQRLDSIDNWGDVGFEQFNCRGCNNLVSMPSIAPSQPLRNIGTFESIFNGCSSLTNVSDGLFDGNTTVTDIRFGFDNCASLTSIPSGLFDDNTSLSNFQETFDNSGLTSIPSGLFDNVAVNASFNATFRNTDVTSISSGLFDNQVSSTDFQRIFENCSSLISIPASLFQNNTIVTSFFSTFASCSSVASVGSNLFNTSANCSWFNTFGGCSSLTSIPSDLFGGSSGNMSCGAIFSGASLTSIPSGLFDGGTLTAINGGFQNTDITSIPSGLFDNGSANCNVSSVFSGCSSLTSIPSGLFDNQTSSTNFSSVFQNCTSLTAIPSGLFSLTAGATTFTNTFNGCTTASGSVDELWNDYPSADGTGCFTNCSGLSNYDDIPENWGGPTVSSSSSSSSIDSSSSSSSIDSSSSSSIDSSSSSSSSSYPSGYVYADFQSLTVGEVDTDNITSPTLTELNNSTQGADWSFEGSPNAIPYIRADAGGSDQALEVSETAGAPTSYASRLDFVKGGISVADIGAGNHIEIRFTTSTKASTGFTRDCHWYINDGTTNLLDFRMDDGDIYLDDIEFGQPSGGADGYGNDPWDSTATYLGKNLVWDVVIKIYSDGSLDVDWDGYTTSKTAGYISTSASINRIETDYDAPSKDCGIYFSKVEVLIDTGSSSSSSSSP